MENDKQSVIGIYGLGTMGRNLLLNMADHGYFVAGYNRHPDKVELLRREYTGERVSGFTDMAAFINRLERPRAILLMVTAGKAVDEVIAGLLPYLDQGDTIIDGGNSHYRDTDRRCQELEARGIAFIGMGISGGEEGARRGPSMMPGGNEAAYRRVRPILEAIAAKVDGEPTVSFLGPGASGHFVKMVHNGIEYAIMQLLAETYDILKKGLRLDHEGVHSVFREWNEGRLHSFLMEVTRDVVGYKEPGQDTPLLESIKDEAKSKGTGKWTSQAAMDLNVPVPLIDIAVAMRDLSKYKACRISVSQMFEKPPVPFSDPSSNFMEELEKGFYFAMVCAYAQGMHLLDKASAEFEFGLKLDQVAKLWRGGCIIRSEFLRDIFRAYREDPGLGHLMLDPVIASALRESEAGIRFLVAGGIRRGLAIPAYASAIGYFDSIRSEMLPANLIQAQRDYFGAHTFEMVGKEGVFHSDWGGGNKAS